MEIRYCACSKLYFQYGTDLDFAEDWTKDHSDCKTRAVYSYSSLSSRFFDLTPVGKLVTRVTNDVEALNEMYSGILVRLFRNIVKIIGLAVVMIALDRGLALVSFVLLPIVMVLTVVFRIISRKIYRLVRTKLTDINTFLSENISGMRVIQIF